MNNERLATIRAGLKACQALSDIYGEDPGPAIRVSLELLSEVDRLRAVNGKLEASLRYDDE